jgi:predicted phage terminase large subunit-like protein
MTNSIEHSRQQKEQRLLLLQEKLRRKASTSLHEFVAQAWHVVEPAVKFSDNWHIGAICEHLEAVTRGQIRRLLINVPFRTAKSTVCSVMWPAWEWIGDPAVKWLCGSYAEKLAIRDNLKMRRLIQAPWYRQRWGRGYNLVDNSDWGDPEGFELTKDQNQKIRFENDRTGYRIAFGSESGVMGEGGNRILIDDWHDRQKAHSDKERESSLITFDQAVSTRLNDPARDPIVAIMQRLHEQDLSGHVLTQGGYEHLLIPMHYDPKRSKVTVLGWSDPRKTAGELMHPARFPAHIVEEIEKTLGSYAAAGQLEQNPAPAEGGILKRSWWKFYDVLPAKLDVELQSWDLAFEGEQDSHFTAGQAWAKVGSQAYLKPDEVYEQLDFPNTCIAFTTFTSRHPRGSKLVEKKANGAALLATLKGKIAGLLPVNPDGDKPSRARAVAPYIEAGNVLLPNPYDIPAERANAGEIGAVRPERAWVMRLIENAAKFPNGSIPPGSHGDDIDSMTQALHKLFNGPPKARVI